MASHGAAREAAKLGYKRVFVMSDGIAGWVRQGKPVEMGGKA